MIPNLALLASFLFFYLPNVASNEVVGCGGFVQSPTKLNYDSIKVKLLTNRGVIKYSSDCAPNNGYYFIPLYDHGNYTLKIESPNGWSFKPNEINFYFDGKTDICSKQSDINFVFKGFSIFGKIQSLNSEDGPKDVPLKLTSKDSSLKLVNFTQKDGSFSFYDILPDQYVLSVSHHSWKFSKNSLNLEVSNENVYLHKSGKTIQVLGYTFTAKVTSDTKPIGDVQFTLFGQNIPQNNLVCNKDRPASLAKLDSVINGFDYLCYVLSGNGDGGIQISNLPTGKYILKAFYELHGIRFDVSPSQYSFEILHDDLAEEKPFEIGGFTISGVVTNKLNPNIAIKDAEVLLLQQNNILSTTKIDPLSGKYSFENIRSSDYSIRVKAANYHFQDIAVSISPKSSQLPTLSPSEYRVCGNVNFDLNVQNQPIELVISDKSSGSLVKKLKIEGNDFCVFLPGEEYLFSVNSESSELRFIPAEFEVNVNQPKKDILFNQFSALISGRIELADNQRMKPEDFIVTLQKSGVVLEMLTGTNLESIKTGFQFRFNNLLPGRYTISLSGKQKTIFCWENDPIDVIIEEKEKSNVIFKQSGYNLQILATHSTEIQLKSPSGKIEAVTEMKSIGTGKSFQHCLPKPGKYQIIPVGCHKFIEEGNEIFYDTRTMAGEVVNLNAVKHSIKTIIVSSSNITDLSVDVHVNHHGEDHVRQISLNDLVVSQKGNLNEYSIILYERPMSHFRIKPKSDQLLFKPIIAEIDLIDDCHQEVIFHGRVGVFINGHIEKNIEDVRIDVFDKLTEQLLTSTHTDSKGNYVVGPFDDEIELRIEAFKNGFIFKSTPSASGSFIHHSSFPLSSIIVNIVDKDGQPLNDVLVSLSGGQNNFRKNSFVDVKGSITFSNLNDGEFFIRFVRKEYQFKPSSEMINLNGGQTIVKEVIGTKVAYSCYGYVNSLNSEPETGVVIEAVGIRKLIESSSIDCISLQEETSSETDGSFRIMGLLPDCQYVVRLKIDDKDSIRESVPRLYSVRSENEDVKDTNFMIIYKQFQTDLIASIEVNDNFLSSLSLRLYKEKESKNILFQTTSMGSPFVFLPQLPLDEQKYTLRLDSSLSSAMYDWKPVTRNFVTNESFVHLHFQFEPRLRSASGTISPGTTDQEITSSSIYILLIILLVLIAYYNNQIWNVFSDYTLYFGGIFKSFQSNKVSEKGTKENENGKKKIKSKKN